MTSNTNTLSDTPSVSVPASPENSSPEDNPSCIQPDTAVDVALPISSSTAPLSENSEEINYSSQLDEDQASLDTSGTRNPGPVATNAIAIAMEIMRPSDVEMPRRISSLPERGTVTFSLLEAQIRPEATSALAVMHPLVSYATRNGVQGYANTEHAALLRLQAPSIAVLVVRDSRVSRFLRSPAGNTLERLIHATTSEERLALDTQLQNPDIWNILFDAPYSDEIAANLIGISLKTLRAYRNRQKGGQ